VAHHPVRPADARGLARAHRPGDAGWGAFVYAVVLSSGAFAGTASFAAFGMAVVAMLAMVRRYAELRIFTSEPGIRTRGWLRDVLDRRTKNTVPRKHY
jgi:hypothetical protein